MIYFEENIISNTTKQLSIREIEPGPLFKLSKRGKESKSVLFLKEFSKSAPWIKYS
jgi:hypothetical protein